MSKAKKKLAEKSIEQGVQYSFGFGVDDSCMLNEWLRVMGLHSAQDETARALVSVDFSAEGKLNYEVAA